MDLRAKVKGKRIFVILGLMFGISVLLGGCDAPKELKSTAVQIPQGELDPAVWGKAYPEHYTSYLKNNSGGMTAFGGSDKISKYVAQPLLPELFKGYGFSLEYNEDRGHTYSLQDVTEIKRVTPKTTASCLTCKTPSAPVLIEQMGVAYYSKPFAETAKNVKHPIACADCHDSRTMELRVTRPAFIEAMAERGIDVSKAGRNEMRAYVCGQCHVEYYFKPDTKQVVYPWKNGFTPREIENYYKEREPGLSDWKHPDSQAPMLKAQHPEFETWQSSVHAAAGVACSDCHMPQERVGSKEITSHWWTSPLKRPEATCGKCHSGLEQRLKWVQKIQSGTFERILQAQTESNRAHKAVQKALSTAGSDPALIKEAQELVVKAQWRWDFVAAENSTGFHNPFFAWKLLKESVQLSRDAQDKAKQALPNKG